MCAIGRLDSATVGVLILLASSHGVGPVQAAAAAAPASAFASTRQSTLVISPFSPPSSHRNVAAPSSTESGEDEWGVPRLPHGSLQLRPVLATNRRRPRHRLAGVVLRVRTDRGMVDDADGGFDASDDSESDSSLSSSSEEDDPLSVVDLASISDEEVLLASVAHLRRRRLLPGPSGGWAASDRRSRLRDRSDALREAGAVEGGYFWENPDELSFLGSGRAAFPPPVLGSGGDGGGGIGIEEEAEEFGFRPGRGWDDDDDEGFGHEDEEDDEDDDDENEEFAVEEEDERSFAASPTHVGRGTEGLFSSTPSEPTGERRRRSEAARRRWDDLEWRRGWYERRWGDNRAAAKGGEDDDDSVDDRGDDVFSKDGDDSADHGVKDDRREGGGGRQKRRKKMSARRLSPEEKRKNLLRRRVEAIPPDVLRSDALEALSEEEVLEAVRTYVGANRRRSEKRRKRNRERKRAEMVVHDDVAMAEAEERGDDSNVEESQEDAAVSPETMTATGASLSAEESAENDAVCPPLTEEERLKEQQRLRSERAARAYRTRLANQKAREEEKDAAEAAASAAAARRRDGHPPPVRPATTTTSSKTSSSSSPAVVAARSALSRIEASLRSDGGASVTSRDLRDLLRPGRMGGRREALRAVLSERYGLRGRCVPEGDKKLLFVTSCPLDLLGDFVISKLREEGK